MKLHTVIIENLNSLYGRHEIDFVRDLDQAPLFLVVGPTGAGKSTIMDAISLALFGMTPRLSDGHGQADTDSRMIMSRGTGRCAAEVVFSKQVSGSRTYYRARWEAWRARDKPNGTFQTPRRSLVQEDALGLPAETLADSTKKKEWAPAFAAVLEGMEPAEFQRSMLLAQGQFAAFLRATVAERAQILERLTSTEEYRLIGARAMARYRAAKAHVDKLRASVDAIDLLDATQLEDLRRQSEMAGAEAVAAENRCRRARKLLDWTRRQAALNNELADATERLEKEERRWNNQAANRDRLAESSRCASAGEVLRRLDALKLDRIRAAGAHDTALQEQEEQAAALERAAVGAETAEAARVEAERLAEQAAPKLKAASDAGEAVRAARAFERARNDDQAAVEVARTSAETARRSIETLVEAGVDDDATLQALTEAVEAASADVARICDGASPGQRVEELQNEQRALAETRARLTGVAAMLDALDHATKAEQAARDRHEQLIAAGPTLSDRARHAAELLDKGKETLALATKLVEAAARELDLWDRRSELVDGDPCPLCGSEHHPYTTHTETDGDVRRRHAEAVVEAEKADAGRGALERALREAENALSAQAARVDAQREAVAAAESRTAELRAEITEKGGADGVSDRETLAAGIDEAEQRATAIDAELEAVATARETLEQAAAESTAFREGRAERESALSAARARLGELESALGVRLEEVAAAQDRLDAAVTAARAATEAVADHVPGDTSLDELEQVLAAAFDGRTPDEARKALHARASEARVSAGAAAEAVAVLRTQQAAVQAKIDDRKREVERISTAFAKAETELVAALEELGLERPSDLAGRVLTADERSLLQEKIDEVRVGYEQARGRSDTLKEQLQEHQEAKPDGLVEGTAFESLELEDQEAAAALELKRKERASLAAQLEAQEAQRTKRSDLIAGLTQAEADAALWNEMRRLIGSNEGGAFQRFAQTLNLAELVGRANVRLRELEPRYELVVARDADGVPELAFAVRDHELGGRIRPQTTLSGGETFLVSLALALALSEYRQTQMPIETLLLDEGFGTLDAETLDVAMSALERLCATGGTQIGVISHVEGLRERINAQIVVEKLGGGRSRLHATT